jgi:hypothetical protein
MILTAAISYSSIPMLIKKFSLTSMYDYYSSITQKVVQKLLCQVQLVDEISRETYTASYVRQEFHIGRLRMRKASLPSPNLMKIIHSTLYHFIEVTSL